MKQITFIEQDDSAPKKYTASIGSPLYIPGDQKPHILELCENSRVRSLLNDIDNSTLDLEQKIFLSRAAQRHMVFNYERIADYYAHAEPEMQRLMEASALVIVDIDQAIELGYVSLCKEIRRLHMEEVASDA